MTIEWTDQALDAAIAAQGIAEKNLWDTGTDPAYLAGRAEAAEAKVEKLREALGSLMLSVIGIWCAFECALRAEIGDANFRVILAKIDVLDVVERTLRSRNKDGG